ncbi:MAG: hypothetical protein ACWGO1_14415 [Anaerolineales bacterium]
MSADLWWAVQITGLCAILGALIYAVGDVLLLAGKAGLVDYPNLQPHNGMFSGSERMVALSWRRITWGGLLGVVDPHMSKCMRSGGFFPSTR